ncbi:MAG: ATP-dependent DNA helicase RecG [Patescibacteria group bacterium]
MELETSVSKLKTAGPTLCRRLQRLGIATVRDLLFYFPFRHEDWSTVAPIRQLHHGDEVTVCGVVELIANRRTSWRRGKMLTEALVRDATGTLRVVWFNQPYLGQQIKQGDTLSFSGRVKEDMFGLQMVSPMWERAGRATNTARIVPVYSATEGVTQKQLRFLMKQALPAVEHIAEWLPDEVRDRADVCGVREAMVQFHFPDSLDALHHAEARLKFDELLLVQMLAVANRAALSAMRAPRIPFDGDAMRAWVAGLPFTLTPHQKKAAWEILQDMEKTQPMNRLLEGDVGSGKTAVAAMAAYSAVRAGFQVAIMAPTEVLAFQHERTFAKLLGAQGIPIGVTTHTKKTERDAPVIIGTHALLEESAQFKNLGLIVVDEQHRFGVEQRKLLKEKSGTDAVPHFLSMSATPIPRSFALTVFGDLDLSIIPELPPGRKPIITRLVEPRNREKAYAFVRKQIEAGRQAFVVCPLIDPSPREEKKAVTEVYEKLSKEIFSDLRVAYLHGRMKGKEKDAVMQQFAKGETDILVSTSVIEVGVDVPNATIMWIEGAERFGLAQLHQFRGRVGRGEHQSYCLAFSESDSEKSVERLRWFEKERNGFVLAEKDLEMRGPGEVFGTAQSGMMHLKLARLTDTALVKKSRDVARWLFTVDRTLAQWPSLKARFNGWRQEVHLE